MADAASPLQTLCAAIAASAESSAPLEEWVQAHGLDADVVTEEKNHGSPLLVACALEAEEACTTLLSMSADVNLRSGGTTPLLCWM